jgi:hypothetical protein
MEYNQSGDTNDVFVDIVGPWEILDLVVYFFLGIIIMLLNTLTLLTSTKTGKLYSSAQLLNAAKIWGYKEYPSILLKIGQSEFLWECIILHQIWV